VVVECGVPVTKGRVPAEEVPVSGAEEVLDGDVVLGEKVPGEGAQEVLGELVVLTGCPLLGTVPVGSAAARGCAVATMVATLVLSIGSFEMGLQATVRGRLIWRIRRRSAATLTRGQSDGVLEMTGDLGLSLVVLIEVQRTAFKAELLGRDA
jgi:hypothetical protein